MSQIYQKFTKILIEVWFNQCSKNESIVVESLFMYKIGQQYWSLNHKIPIYRRNWLIENTILLFKLKAIQNQGTKQFWYFDILIMNYAFFHLLYMKLMSRSAIIDFWINWLKLHIHTRKKFALLHFSWTHGIGQELEIHLY